MDPELARLAHERREAADGDRWAAHRGLAVLVGGAVTLVPVGVAFAVSLVVVRLVPRPTSGAGLWLWWALVVATPWMVYGGTRRLARRALPLATLLRMTLVFPDKAPSRIAVARRAGGTRSLERQLAEDRRAGREDEPVVAAERILGLAASLHQHDRPTRGHSERVRALTDVIADEMRIPEADKDRLRWSALLHDIGKLSVPGTLLNKPGEPDDDELAVLRRHPDEGARLVAPLADWLGPWARSIPEHHEKFDGTGYPRGLAGKDISLGGRIVAVADCFETMTATRSYKMATSIESARRELADCAGTHFDPVVVRAFLEASLARRSVIGAPLAALAVLARLAVVQRVGQVATSAGHLTTGALVSTSVGVATVVGVVHVAPTSGPVAATTTSAHVGAPQAGSAGAKARAAAPASPAASTHAPAPTHAPARDPRGPSAGPAAPPGSNHAANPGAAAQAADGGTAAAPSTQSAPGTQSAAGVTPGSDTTGTVTQPTVPGIPTGLSVTGGNGQVTLRWSAPAGDGGSPVSGYEVTPYVGGVAQSAVVYPSTATVQTVQGLIGGAAYTFTVAAINGVGQGTPSDFSAAVTPGAPSG